MNKTISKILVENSLRHKEVIEPSLNNALLNRTHYNAKSSIYPELIGKGNYLADISQKHFISKVNKLKRLFDTEDINPKEYFKIKRDISNLMKKTHDIESEFLDELADLAEKIIRETFDIPSDIKFSINGDEVEDFDGENILEKFKDTYNDFSFDDYSGIKSANSVVDRQRMNYCLICGGANKSMELYKSYEDELDEIDYRLHGLYDKFNTFNNFNIWVTPDEMLKESYEEVAKFKILDDGDDYLISIEAPSFLSILYEMSKSVLSILFQEKYNNPHVDYDNPWNTRIGSIMWHKFRRCAKDNKNFPYVIDSINKLEDDDYSYVFKEILAETNHSKKIFKELYEDLEKTIN